MSYFLGTENVNRISLKINLLFHRKDQRKCKAITDAQFSEQTWCGTKEERTLLPAINIPSCLRLGKQLYFFSRRLRYIPQGKMETCFGKRLKKKYHTINRSNIKHAWRACHIWKWAKWLVKLRLIWSLQYSVGAGERQRWCGTKKGAGKENNRMICWEVAMLSSACYRLLVDILWVSWKASKCEYEG